MRVKRERVKQIRGGRKKERKRAEKIEAEQDHEKGKAVGRENGCSRKRKKVKEKKKDGEGITREK